MWYIYSKMSIGNWFLFIFFVFAILILLAIMWVSHNKEFVTNLASMSSKYRSRSFSQQAQNPATSFAPITSQSQQPHQQPYQQPYQQQPYKQPQPYTPVKNPPPQPTAPRSPIYQEFPSQ